MRLVLTALLFSFAMNVSAVALVTPSGPIKAEGACPTVMNNTLPVIPNPYAFVKNWLKWIINPYLVND